MKTRSALFALALLVPVLAWQWHDWPPPPPEASAARSAPSATEASPGPAADSFDPLSPLAEKERYASITERPLFRSDRRPLPREGKQAEKSPSNLARMNLNAILITPSESSAWIWDPGQKALVRLGLGDELAGWSVREILSDRVRLERQEEKDTLGGVLN